MKATTKGLPMLPPVTIEENRANLNNKLANDTGFRTLHGSAVGMMIRMMQSLSGADETVDSTDLRESVAEMLNGILETTSPDLTTWSNLRGTMKYDAYLKMREDTDRLSELDLIRSGLQEHEFTTMLAYFDHYQRVMDHQKDRAARGLAVGKACNKCGLEKPLSAFKRGAVCKACNSKAYRERKANLAEDETIREIMAGDINGLN